LGDECLGEVRCMTIPLADREANAALRRARLGLGMSQSEFARALREAGVSAGEPNGATKRLVQKWESGEFRGCRPNYARALKAVTGLSVRQLGLAGFGPGPQDAEQGEAGRGIADVVVDSGRDAALRLSVALERPRRARPEQVGALCEHSEGLFALEQVTPARTLLPSVERHLLETAAVLAGTTSTRARGVLSLAGAQAALVAGRLLLNYGDLSTAERYFESAMAAARAGGDSPLWAYCATFAAGVQAHGDPRSAWQSARDALQDAGELAAVRGWVAVRAAQQAARCGSHKAALMHLETVAALDREMQDTSRDADTPPWARDIDRAVLAAMTAQVYAALGDHQAAFEHSEQAVAWVTSEPVKWRAVILAEAACAAARLGKTRQAQPWAAEARTLATDLQCTIAQRKLRTLKP